MDSEGQGRRVLIVDDDADVRDVIADALRLAPAEYEVETDFRKAVPSQAGR